jgi:hypothetical protein
MIRQIIVPTENTFLLHLPDSLIGKKVEVIAFSSDDIATEKTVFNIHKKRSLEEALAFYKKNAVDFTKIEKWTRDDLYE